MKTKKVKRPSFSKVLEILREKQFKKCSPELLNHCIGCGAYPKLGQTCKSDCWLKEILDRV